jgi:hypothetical protein
MFLEIFVLLSDYAMRTGIPQIGFTVYCKFVDRRMALKQMGNIAKAREEIL